MQLRGIPAAAIPAIGSLIIATGVAHAEPAPDITYSAKLVDRTVVAALRDGTFELSRAPRDRATDADARLTERDGVLVDRNGARADVAQVIDVVDVRDRDGRVAMTLPLDFRVAGTAIPVRPELKKDSTVLELTPARPEGVATAETLVATPIASMTENRRARDEFASQFGLATAVGGFVGTAIGATIGCLVTIAVGCVAGLLTGASLGGILGTIAIGGPALVVAGVDLLTTLQAADGSTRFADKPAQSLPAQPK
ncbi:hypothetical protein OHA40_04260 [Nocardia sp. NBC_00508]|uniref:hypothetical protein n=1 Tax=Nocardia sp. NBC_00508 TaxID=2975992 RepID=UPI002E800E5E|nr:hypothetical protein [Nocardia sp. NBC_00508]WUD67373.1 hypothetical protein OHA40_04260 [Nocardia sp. NBC_00508]